MFNTFLDTKRTLGIIVFWWLFIVVTIVTTIAIWKWAFPTQQIGTNPNDTPYTRSVKMINVLCAGKGTYDLEWADQTKGVIQNMICNY